MNIFEYCKRNHLIFGIIIIDLICFVSYFLSNGVSILFLGDIQMLAGAVVGTYFSIYFLEYKKSSLIYGILISTVGTLLSAFSLTFFQFSFSSSFTISILYIYLIPAIIIGPMVGIIIGAFFYFKRRNAPKSNEDAEFYKSLEEH